jgi:hypothetical protein
VSPRGEGNVVSIEFNLLYRWHSALSKEDTKWTEEMFADVLKTTDFGSVRWGFEWFGCDLTLHRLLMRVSVLGYY